MQGKIFVPLERFTQRSIVYGLKQCGLVGCCVLVTFLLLSLASSAAALTPTSTSLCGNADACLQSKHGKFQCKSFCFVEISPQLWLSQVVCRAGYYQCFKLNPKYNSSSVVQQSLNNVFVSISKSFVERADHVSSTACKSLLLTSRPQARRGRWVPICCLDFAVTTSS